MESSAKSKINVSEVNVCFSPTVLVIGSQVHFYFYVNVHFLQIFYDLVRQINSKTPEKPEKKKKRGCLVL